VDFELPSYIAGMQGVVVTPKHKKPLDSWIWIVLCPIFLVIGYFISIEAMTLYAALLLLPVMNSLYNLRAKNLKCPDSLQSAEIVAWGNKGLYEVDFVRNLDVKEEKMKEKEWNMSRCVDRRSAKRARSVISLAILIPALLIGAVVIFCHFDTVYMIFVGGAVLFLCAFAAVPMLGMPSKETEGKRYIVFYGMSEGIMVVFVPLEMYYGIEMNIDALTDRP